MLVLLTRFCCSSGSGTPGLTSDFFGGDDGIRTHDPLLAKQVLCQLSYVPGVGTTVPGPLPAFWSAEGDGFRPLLQARRSCRAPTGRPGRPGPN
jgi:hypothetical protein